MFRNYTAITVELDGTLQFATLPVDSFWTSRRVAAGRGAALDAVSDYRTADFALGRPGIACLIAGANHRVDLTQPENHVARTIIDRHGPGTDQPIRGRAVILAGWACDPRPILEPVARELIAQITTDLAATPHAA
ncbi:hypothetical protein OPAG_08368 [Rhodococcus opacus PD630]|uniref:hypothetical protein n=1 Tax=Rhodococcus opacus TaxID=37919 RepID=UPI00029CB580|nr:hypothetical protein [Rhodococcus opacus]EHI39088.1 hypothetical protein OPAG_08368 [Rhodococcus opacus PD630]UDH01752.1 hypothetical protein K2Z90_008211 [Rhodococcus opacus PD630]